MTLRNKLQTLTGPCREVDAEIAVMFEPNKRWVYDPMDEHGPRNFSPYYTASLDATVELVERELPKLPEWIELEWTLQAAPGGYWACAGHEYSTESGALHKLPAVALLLALLDAKEIE